MVAPKRGLRQPGDVDGDVARRAGAAAAARSRAPSCRATLLTQQRSTRRCSWPAARRVLIREPPRKHRQTRARALLSAPPRKTYGSPACGSRLTPCCTCSAGPNMAPTHVRAAGGDPDPNVAVDRDSRRSDRTATKAGDASAAIRSIEPPPSSTNAARCDRLRSGADGQCCNAGRHRRGQITPPPV